MLTLLHRMRKWPLNKPLLPIIKYMPISSLMWKDPERSPVRLYCEPNRAAKCCSDGSLPALLVYVSHGS